MRQAAINDARAALDRALVDLAELPASRHSAAPSGFNGLLSVRVYRHRIKRTFKILGRSLIKKTKKRIRID